MSGNTSKPKSDEKKESTEAAEKGSQPLLATQAIEAESEAKPPRPPK